MNMFKPTTAKTPKEYIAMIEDPKRRGEIQELHDLILKTAPELDPHILSGMLGYGTYPYKTAAGKTGEWSKLALASQKNYISLYVCCLVDGHYLAEDFVDKLPKANIGKSCIRFNHLADVDLGVIKELIIAAVAADPLGH
jgi:uncharacterized protein YdhG (YjbR/CyaY superfamily)